MKLLVQIKNITCNETGKIFITFYQGANTQWTHHMNILTFYIKVNIFLKDFKVFLGVLEFCITIWQLYVRSCFIILAPGLAIMD